MSKRVKIVDVREFPTGVYRWSVKLECGHMLLRSQSPRKQKTVNRCYACEEEHEDKMADKARALVRARSSGIGKRGMF